MASLIMANMNTLIRKGYLLAGVIMAANMFIVNEVRAMDDNEETEEKQKKSDDLNKEKEQDNDKKKIEESGSEGKGSATQAVTLATLLEKKVFINFLGTFAVSCLNNYFNLWDYKSGKYLDWKFGFFGWRTKRFLNDYLQFEVNLNVYRGLGWGILNMVDYKRKGGEVVSMQKLIFRFVTGFISMPLTLHIFNFSIAISLDSIVYGVVEIISNRWWKNKNADVEKWKGKNEEELLDIENKKKSETNSAEEVIINNNEKNKAENGETDEINNENDKP